MKRSLLKRLNIEVGDNTNIIGPIFIGYCSNVKIGKNNHIGKNFVINGNGNLIIGDNCDIAPDVIIGTGTHQIGDTNRRGGKGKNCSIKIGNGCWIGTRVTIIGDTEIGNGVVIGACALVNKNINDNLLVGGVPIKKIKELR